ncbi:unnamed protein product [Cylindrotheca closterium]|uniref:Uncharacterized protein n=1 Tax=Cylindrotheca closterium TaxID=2856 RepID=A0AAD2CQ34_9STRA|nr:unnamed protein product [Cylindrotheca closterium]
MKVSFAITTMALLSHDALGFSMKNERHNVESLDTGRRNLLTVVPAALVASQSAAFWGAEPAFATPAAAFDDLPPDAAKSYYQYRIPLQLAADYYIFELQEKVGNLDEWGNIGQLFASNNARGGQGQPSRIERDFVNPMRIVLLSMPPDVSDEMREAQFKFEAAMQQISKATGGYRKDLPVEVPRSSIDNALKGWEDGRLAYNQFLVLLNGVTGLSEMKPVPPAGPDQRDQYGRSYRKYNELVKKTKLCQNRGGPALSQAWGQLMVSGYLQDSCGIPDLENYFKQ